MTADQLQFIRDEFPIMDAFTARNFPMKSSTSYNRLRRRAMAMELALVRVARLNPDAGEIGAGMLHTIVSESRNALS